MVSWENSPKKEGAYPKREIDTERLQKSDIHHKVYQFDYKSWIWTTNSTHKLQKTTKLRHRLQRFTDTKFVVSAF